MRALTLLYLLAAGAAMTVSAASIPTTFPSRTQVPLGAFPVPANHPFLTTATDATMRELVIENTKPVLVCFYKKGDQLSATVSKGIEQTALALRPLVDVFVMDGESEGAKQLLGTYGVTNLPVILQFNSDLHPIPQAPNQWAKLPEGYQGDGTPGSLVRWSLGKLNAATVERVTDAHTLGHFLSIHDHLAYPKVLLVTNETVSSNATSPLFLSMAQKMRKAAVFGVAHGVKDVIDRYQITEFPTVLGFIPEDSMGHSFTLTKLPPFPSASMTGQEGTVGGDSKLSEEEEAKRKRDQARTERRNERLRKRGMEAAEEDGPSAGGEGKATEPNLLFGDVEYEVALADYTHFEEWVASIGIPASKQPEYSMLIANEEEADRNRAKEMAKWAAATEPIVITDTEAWLKQCVKSKTKGVCLVVFRDMGDFDTASEKQRNKNLGIEMLKEASRKAAMKSQTPLQIAVADGTTNYQLVSALGIANGVPDMVAIWPAKKKFYNFLGAINERNVLSLFLDRALKDKNGKAFDVDALPTFLKTGQASDSAEGSGSEEGHAMNAERRTGDDDDISDEM